MRLRQLRYQCDNCGLCCQQTLVKCGPGDLDREPKLRELRRVKVNGVITDEWLLNKEPDESGCGCRFHTGTGCGIYATRPGVCVGFEAGNPDCQSLRARFGLEPLKPSPVEWEETYVEVEMLNEPPDSR